MSGRAAGSDGQSGKLMDGTRIDPRADYCFWIVARRTSGPVGVFGARLFSAVTNTSKSFKLVVVLNSMAGETIRCKFLPVA